MKSGCRVGRVQQHDAGLGWRVVFPDVEHGAASSYLRQLAASDCSPATIRGYAYALLRWFRFLHERLVGWDAPNAPTCAGSWSICERTRTRNDCAAPTARRPARSTRARAN